jgi:hypothetical protein
MKNTILLSVLILAFSAIAIHAQSNCKQAVEQIAKDLSSAFTEKKLGRLDAKRSAFGKVKLTIEDSNAGDDDSGRLVYKTFANLNAIEKWLGKPLGRSVSAFRCKKGVCIFAGEALLHNNLYLKKITFGFTKNKCPYIKSIYILEG